MNNTDPDQAYGSNDVFGDEMSDAGCSSASDLLERIERSNNEAVILCNVIELCQLLVMGSEETLTGFPTKRSVPCLTNLLRTESNFEITLHACRALQYLIEVLPRSTQVVLEAVPALLEKLQVVECVDVAEQSLQVLDLLSKKHSKVILKQVVWIDKLLIPLTHGEYRVIDDHRFSVVRMDVNDWNLQITYVKGSDAGTYLCSVNSLPIKEKKVNLFVKVPPKIIRQHSTNDISAREGDSIGLNCTATGSPKPLITWYRKVEDQLPGCVISPGEGELVYNQSHLAGSVWSYLGEELTITNISRKCKGRIRCLASNDIPDTDEEDFMLSVQFSPEISLPTRRLGQVLGSRETILNCIIRASPLAINYWQKNTMRLDKSPKYRVDAYPEDEFSITLSISISDLSAEDYGDYRCVASNYLGSAQDVVHLFQVKPSRSLNRMHEKDKEASLDAPTKTQLFVHSSLLEHKLPDDGRSESSKPSTTMTSIIFISFAWRAI